MTAVTLAGEMMGLPQVFTGPFVNMMLLLTTLFLGSLAGVTLGVITPMVALLRGQLPPALIPMVPFIAVGNAVLVLFFSWVCRKDSKDSILLVKVRCWAGIIFGAIAKFLWLTTSVCFVLPAVLGIKLPDAVVAMMVMPQLFTALVGGVLALAIFKVLQKRR